MYSFEFTHSSPEKPARREDFPVQKKTRNRFGTLATISKRAGRGETPFAEGVAYLRPGEQFARPSGRKYAVAKAIHGAIPRLGRHDKEGATARYKVWADFFKAFPAAKESK